MASEVLYLISSVSRGINRVGDGRDLRTGPRLHHGGGVGSVRSSLYVRTGSLALNRIESIVGNCAILNSKGRVERIGGTCTTCRRVSGVGPCGLGSLGHLRNIVAGCLMRRSNIFHGKRRDVFGNSRYVFVTPPTEFIPRRVSGLFG